MEINGYGYGNFVQYKSNIQLPLYEIPVTEGEFILNLQDGKKQLFKPIHFSFKAPSEHTIRGRHFDLEMQILHHYKGTDEQLGAVISIFLDRGSEDGEESVLLKSIFQVLDSGLQGTIRLQDFLQNVDFGSYWNYDGSLTTPPC